MAKEKTQCFLHYEEDSVSKRKAVNRGFGAMNQVETLITFSESVVKIPKKNRLHTGGSNLGNLIGPIGLTPFDSSDVWKLTPASKKKLLGQVGKILVGGACPAEDGASANPKPTFENGTTEPVMWWSSPVKLYEEFLHSFCLKAVIDLTAGDGHFALACLREKKPYVGVVFGECHRDMLYARLVRQVFKEMRKEDSPLYQAALAGVLDPLEAETEGAKTKKRKAKAGGAGGQKDDAAPKKKKGGKKATKAELLAKLQSLQGGKNPGGDDAVGGGEDEQHEDGEDGEDESEDSNK